MQTFKVSRIMVVQDTHIDVPALWRFNYKFEIWFHIHMEINLHLTLGALYTMHLTIFSQSAYMHTSICSACMHQSALQACINVWVYGQLLLLVLVYSICTCRGANKTQFKEICHLVYECHDVVMMSTYGSVIKSHANAWSTNNAVKALCDNVDCSSTKV